MQPTDSDKHDPYLHQTIARNMTDAELAHRLDSGEILIEYKAEAIRRFAGLGIASLTEDPAKQDLEEALEEPAIKDACDEMCAELEHGRDYL